MDSHGVPINELARRCAHSADAAEWQEFLRVCVPVASRVAGRVARLWMGTATAAVVDDIVQEIFLKLCEQERRILREFKPRGDDSFFGLLRLVSASAANDYFRRQNSEKRGGKVMTVALEDAAYGEAARTEGYAGVQRSVLLSELDTRLRRAPEPIGERDRAIFWLYYLQGLTAEEIAGLPHYRLSAKGVESALRRVTQWLRKDLHPQEKPGPAEAPQEAG